VKVDWLSHNTGHLLEAAPRLLAGLGRLEWSWFERRFSRLAIKQPIFVTGLARSGTTLILEFLDAHNETASHRYRDFPFVCFPVWWSWFLDHAGGATQTATERAHRDRIFVTRESPEAMEEILWMTFFPDCHDVAVSSVLRATDRHPGFEDFYTAHIRKILFLRGGTRYLSKNNYNVARLAYLRYLFPDARFVIPVREPVAQIGSLMRQHRLFCESALSDDRLRPYMRRAGHFEFGPDRRAISFDANDVAPQIQNLWEKGEEVRGWAAYWASVYGFVVDLLASDDALASNTLIVDYDELCRRPFEALHAIHEFCALSLDDETIARQAAGVSSPTYYSNELSDEDIATIQSETASVFERMHQSGRMIFR
jgi:hypothetical protein